MRIFFSACDPKHCNSVQNSLSSQKASPVGEAFSFLFSAKRRNDLRVYFSGSLRNRSANASASALSATIRSNVIRLSTSSRSRSSTVNVPFSRGVTRPCTCCRRTAALFQAAICLSDSCLTEYGRLLSQIPLFLRPFSVITYCPSSVTRRCSVFTRSPRHSA